MRAGRRRHLRQAIRLEARSLPRGYDHKYIFSHIGYNLKVTDMQAAVGVAQLQKLAGFVEARKRNWQRLREGLAPYEDVLILPRADRRSDPSWFGFLITVRESAPFTRDDLVGYLEQRRIADAASLRRQPHPSTRVQAIEHRVVGDLRNSRPHHEQHLLDRRLSRPDGRDARLRARNGSRFVERPVTARAGTV